VQTFSLHAFSRAEKVLEIAHRTNQRRVGFLFLKTTTIIITQSLKAQAKTLFCLGLRAVITLPSHQKIIILRIEHLNVSNSTHSMCHQLMQQEHKA